MIVILVIPNINVRDLFSFFAIMAFVGLLNHHAGPTMFVLYLAVLDATQGVVKLL